MIAARHSYGDLLVVASAQSGRGFHVAWNCLESRQAAWIPPNDADPDAEIPGRGAEAAATLAKSTAGAVATQQQPPFCAGRKTAAIPLRKGGCKGVVIAAVPTTPVLRRAQNRPLC
jgi:hypothetical protein